MPSGRGGRRLARPANELLSPAPDEVLGISQRHLTVEPM